MSEVTPPGQATPEDLITCIWCGATDQTIGIACVHCGQRVVHVPAWARAYPSAYKRLVTKRRVLGLVAVMAVLGFIFWLNFPFLPDPAIILFKRPTTDLSSDTLPRSWTMDGGNLAQTRALERPNRQPIGQGAWSSELGAPTRSPAIVADNVIYIGGQFKIMALAADTGHLLWELEATGPVHSSLAVADNTLYYAMLDHRLIALNLKDREPLWEFKARDSINASPVVNNGMVYIGSADGNLYALDAANGKLIWEFQAGEPINQQPAIRDGILFITDSPGNLYILNARTGQERLRFRTPGPINASPVVANDMVYFPSGGTLFTVDSGSKEIPGQFQFKRVWAQLWLWQVPGVPHPPGQQGGKWRFSSGASRLGVNTSPAIAVDTLYFGNLDGTVRALDPLKGKELWNFDADAGIAASPVVVGDRLYVGSRAGTIYALERHTGEVLWQLSFGAGIQVPVTFSGGVLYVRTVDGLLHAVE